MRKRSIIKKEPEKLKFKTEVEFKNSHDLEIFQKFRRRMRRVGGDLGAWLTEKVKADMYAATEGELLSADGAIDFVLAEFDWIISHNELKSWRNKKQKPKLRKNVDYIGKYYSPTREQFFYKKKRLKKFVAELLEARRVREEKRGIKRLADQPQVRVLNVQQKIIPMRTFRSEE